MNTKSTKQPTALDRFLEHRSNISSQFDAYSALEGGVFAFPFEDIDWKHVEIVQRIEKLLDELLILAS